MDSINNTCKLGSDAWLELQAFKTRQLNRREKLSRHKNLNNDLLNLNSLNQSSNQSNLITPTLTNTGSSSTTSSHRTPTSQPSHSSSISSSDQVQDDDCSNPHSKKDNSNLSESANSSKSNEANSFLVASTSTSSHSANLELAECLLILKLCDVALKLPIDSKSLQRSICRIRNLENTPKSLIENLLQKFAHQELITIEEPTSSLLRRRRQHNILDSDRSGEFADDDDESCIYVTSADHTKLVEFDKSFGSLENIKALLTESKTEDQGADEMDSSIIKSFGSVPIQAVRSFSSRDDFFSRDLKSISARGEYSCSNHLNPTSKSNADTKDSDSYDLESLLSLSSTRERESKKLGEELLELLSKPTAKEKNLLEKFRSADGYQVQEFCPKGTKGECIRNNSNGNKHCNKLHFKKIIARHTEESLGDCSFLNTCFHMDSCKYVHYEVDYDDGKKPADSQFKRPYMVTAAQDKSSTGKQQKNLSVRIDPGDGSALNIRPKNELESIGGGPSLSPTSSMRRKTDFNKTLVKEAGEVQIDATGKSKRFKTVLCPPQWIQCDLRFFDMSLLGKFSVVMADPPWDIHMELPYGTMSDDEMRKLNIPTLQDEGVIFLWVTGRAMELGRECLALWGYERCDEIIWVKTNQLQRIIRTGRTGHWLNHGKEHCLVGVKGNPRDINRGLDCDVIVAEVRATSHKPDEIYGIIERLSPGTRKIELFGRAHNVQPNWITLGNQLNGVNLVEPNLVNAFKKLNLPHKTADDPS